MGGDTRQSEETDLALGVAIERAWSALQIYGDTHPTFTDAARMACQAASENAGDDLHLLTDPGMNPGAEGAAGSLLATLQALDIGAIRLAPGIESSVLASALGTIRSAKAEGVSGPDLAERVSAIAGPALSLVPLDYARLASRVSGDQPTARDAGRLNAGGLRAVLLGAADDRSIQDARSWITRAVRQGGDELEQASTELRDAIHDARQHGDDRAESLHHIRDVLGSLSPEVRAGLLCDERGPDLDSISDLAGLIPVMETCEALAEAELSPESMCHSTLMMFQRLATLSAGNERELGRVEHLAALVVDDSDESQQGRALRSLRDLCHQARREEFTPKEYLDRLHEISAGQIDACAAPPELDWESDAQERTHAAEIILELLRHDIGAESLRAGQLRALAGVMPHAASVGRPDVLCDAIDVCAPLESHADETIRDHASALRAASEDVSSFSVALAGVTSREQFDASVDRVAQRGDDTLVRVLLGAYSTGASGPAGAWIAERLMQAGPALGPAIGTLLASDPGMLEVLLSLINRLEAHDAFEAIQPALTSHADDEARRRAFAAAYTLRHPWPPDLCHRALVENDDKIRALGVAYVIRRAPREMTPLLSRRLMHALGGPAPTPQDRALIIDSLVNTGSAEASRALTDALIAAAWRPFGAPSAPRRGSAPRCEPASGPARSAPDPPSPSSSGASRPTAWSRPSARSRETTMPAESIDAALVAINAASACWRLYGDGHPAIEMHARRAADAVRNHTLPCRVVFLEDKVVCDGASLPSGRALIDGAFARMGAALADCLELSDAITEQSVLALIDLLRGGASSAPMPGIRLCWIDHAPSTIRPESETVSIGDPGFLSHELRTLWDRTARTREAPVKSVEALAGDVVAAVSAGSATVLPMAQLKNHDEYTYVHAINVGVMSSALARAVGLSQDRVFDITCAALLHDVGKSAISLEIINKAGKLDESERARMNDHPAEGAAILAASPGLAPVAVSVAYEHHMTLDGGGYPSTPKGWKVALASQVVHIADVFDALRTHRPYREAMPMDKALSILDEQAGVAFDTELYRVFVDHVLEAAPERDDATPPAARVA